MLLKWIARKGEQFTPELEWLWRARGDPLTQWFRDGLRCRPHAPRNASSYFWLPFSRGKGLGVRLLRGRFHRGMSLRFHRGQVA